MDAQIDHIVLWVDDPRRSLAFYEEMFDARGERAEEFFAGTASFPSVRISSATVIDLMPRAMAAAVNTLTGSDHAAGHPVNHLCLALGADEYLALSARLEDCAVPTFARSKGNFGARGLAAESFYFHDPDGNVIEVRYYA